SEFLMKTRNPFQGGDESDTAMREITAIIAEARGQGRGLQELTPGERNAIAELERSIRSPQGSGKPLHIDQRRVQRLKARLAYFCELIAWSRWPRYPIHGILILLPFESMRSTADASEARAACEGDLSTAIEIFRIQCPVFVMVCELDRLPG